MKEGSKELKQGRDFFSVVDEETRKKELTTHPSQIKNRKLFGKRSWKSRERKERERLRSRGPRRLFLLTLQGKYRNLSVLYNWRQKKSDLYDKTGDVSVFFPKRKDYLEDGSRYPTDVPPRWYNQNNRWCLSFKEYAQAWRGLEKEMGYSHQDRGLGKDESPYTWKPDALVGRRSYGSLKFGRIDRNLPFQLGNIEFYIPFNKKEKEELFSQEWPVWYGPMGAYLVHKACEDSLPELKKENCSSPPPPSTIRVNRGYVESMGRSVFENIPIIGELFMYRDRLVVYRT